jgi:hypothetical protein
MEYQVDCECGDYVTVEETDAGTTAQCRCGRAIQVPSLSELRRSAGVAESGISPELVVESLLLAGELPEEDYCVLCGVPTEHCIICSTECARAHVESGEHPWWVHAFAFLTFGWLGALLAQFTQRDAKQSGRDIIFSLPLRICDFCRQEITNPAELKAAMSRVPLYRRLLNKYPEARVSLLAS